MKTTPRPAAQLELADYETEELRNALETNPKSSYGDEWNWRADEACPYWYGENGPFNVNVSLRHVIALGFTASAYCRALARLLNHRLYTGERSDYYLGYGYSYTVRLFADKPVYLGSHEGDNAAPSSPAGDDQDDDKDSEAGE